MGEGWLGIEPLPLDDSLTTPEPPTYPGIQPKNTTPTRNKHIKKEKKKKVGGTEKDAVLSKLHFMFVYILLNDCLFPERSSPFSVQLLNLFRSFIYLFILFNPFPADVAFVRLDRDN
jgi:hypothetical protein